MSPLRVRGLGVIAIFSANLQSVYSFNGYICSAPQYKTKKKKLAELNCI